VWLVVALAVAFPSAGWGEDQTIELSLDEAIALATRLLVEARTEQAASVVRALKQSFPDQPQVLFLEGQVALQEGRYADAVEGFRRILSRDPGLVRVRLELARALFLARDFQAARYHFEQVLGGDLPEPVRQNVYRFLTRIDAETSWLSLTLSVGPDSNPSFATTAESVDIFGRKFVLSPEARAREAVGLVAFAQARKAFGAENRAFLRGDIELREFPDSYADFIYAQSTLGRNFVSGSTVWTAELGPLGSLYQGRGLYWGGIAQLTHASPLSPRVLSSQFVALKGLSYDEFSYLSGAQVWSGADVRYSIDSVSGFSMGVLLGRNWAAESPYSYSALQLSAGYARELPRRFNTSVRVTVSQYDYDSPLPLFEKVREDKLVVLDLTVIARDWAVRGFAPMVTVGFSWSDSTIELFEYQRQYFGVGITRNF
jgi:tetratricopeptide (TPR) repeat protein